MLEEKVHYSRHTGQMSFEISVDRDEVLSLIKQIRAQTDQLSYLSSQLVAAIQVEENSQAHR